MSKGADVGAERDGKESVQLQLEGTSIELVVSYERSLTGLTQAISVDGVDYVSNQRDCRPDLPAEDSWWLAYLQGSVPSPAATTRSLRVVDLFCASGGLSNGLGLAAGALGLGSRTSIAVDTDAEALDVFAANHHPDVAINRSVRDLVAYSVVSEDGRAEFGNEPRIVADDVAEHVGQVDVLVAGPPCQGHSTFNNRSRFNDPRNRLYLAVPAMAIALGVPAVIIENVPGVRASREGVAKSSVELLRGAGYEVTHSVIRADQIGWPQRRSRFFIVATKGWQSVNLTDAAKAFAREPRPISLILDDLLDADEGTVMTDHPILSDQNVSRIDYLHDNGLYDLPNDQRPDCHKDGTTYGAVYGRMNWDEPAQTITTGFLTPGRGRYVHPLRRRTISPREAARLQGFPDSHQFFGANDSQPTRSALTKWIGDAVPSPLGMVAGVAALAKMPR